MPIAHEQPLKTRRRKICSMATYFGRVSWTRSSCFQNAPSALTRIYLVCVYICHKTVTKKTENTVGGIKRVVHPIIAFCPAAGKNFQAAPKRTNFIHRRSRPSSTDLDASGLQQFVCEPVTFLRTPVLFFRRYRRPPGPRPPPVHFRIEGHANRWGPARRRRRSAHVQNPRRSNDRRSQMFD